MIHELYKLSGFDEHLNSTKLTLILFQPLESQIIEEQFLSKSSPPPPVIVQDGFRRNQDI